MQENAKTPRSNSGPGKKGRRRISRIARTIKQSVHNRRNIDFLTVKARAVEEIRYSQSTRMPSLQRHDMAIELKQPV